MHLAKWGLWNLSISMLVFLTIYNIFLSVKLMYSATCATLPATADDSTSKIVHKQCEMNPQSIENTVRTDRPPRSFGNLNLDLGRLDNQLKYKIFDNLIVGDRFAELNKVFSTCLATQSSLDKLASIIEVSLYWGGPISLAVFATKEKELNRLLLYILYLRKCNDRIRDKIAFHLVVPAENGPKKYHVDEERLERLECGNPVGVLKILQKETQEKVYPSWKARVAYPQNHLRNVARKNCHARHVFLTDVDIVPSKGMAERLNDFLPKQKCQKKCAYVVPTYEIDERVLFPPNKTDLIRLAKKGLARPFHHKVFIYNQYATNFSRWQQYKDGDQEVTVSHSVTNFEFLYEPFYIAFDAAPMHDERFIGYGYTRNTQVYEMYVAGYEFLVLSPIFTCHWGLQVKRTRPSWREHQNSMNRKQFDNFKREIFARYNKDPLNMMSPRKN
ncbi:beta-1,4-glucuronyltransferase 1 [Cylas formicarius]|uniref:beta-1,4-glucuronyltransferase 1 n=1 Tax=Cylas formicarius TaxID=197179 RepID=UPI002958691C|nr:beta-1,4-glucuronyltransferase 1 [Cylas formicarius]